MKTTRSLAAALALFTLLLFVGCNNTASPTPDNPAATSAADQTQATTPDAVTLTAEDAKAIALSHAGLTAESVTGLFATYDIDDGIPKYEVTFRNGDYEYDYDINAKTGAVISYDKDNERFD